MHADGSKFSPTDGHMPIHRTDVPLLIHSLDDVLSLHCDLCGATFRQHVPPPPHIANLGALLEELSTENAGIDLLADIPAPMHFCMN